MIVFCGDTHHRDDEPRYSAGEELFNWIAEQDFDRPENTFVHMGDVTHGSLVSGKVFQSVIDFFNNKLKFGRIVIIAGNHDYHRSSKSSSVDPLSALDRVEVYRQPAEITLEGEPTLLLPYYYKSTVDGIPEMRDYYAALPDEWAQKEWRFILGHYNDETETVFGSFIDTAYLKGTRILGHIHFPRGNYIGTPIITRKDEAGNNNRLLVYDGGKLESYPTPRLVDYYEETYPNPLPEVEAKYPIWDIVDAPSEDAMYDRYEGHTVRMKKKKATEDTNSNEEEGATAKQDVSLKDHLTSFFEKKDYDEKVRNKLEEVLG